MSSSTSLAVTLTHAITYLTACLHKQVAPAKITKLQLLLEANLTAHYGPTWVPSEPLRGSGRRCLSLSPDSLPPRVIYNACVGAGVQWFDWMNVLGGQAFEFFVDPGCVSVRVGENFVTVWADEIPSPTVAPFPFKVSLYRFISFISFMPVGLTVMIIGSREDPCAALIENDDADSEQIFAMIAHETSKSSNGSTWMTSVLDQFPMPRSISPLSTSSASSSDSGYSDRPSRRERARQAKVYIDTSKTEVTQYEGGRTTVLTGGVMLGGSPPKTRSRGSPSHSRASSAMDWRPIRA